MTSGLWAIAIMVIAIVVLAGMAAKFRWAASTDGASERAAIGAAHVADMEARIARPHGDFGSSLHFAQMDSQAALMFRASQGDKAAQWELEAEAWREADKAGWPEVPLREPVKPPRMLDAY